MAELSSEALERARLSIGELRLVADELDRLLERATWVRWARQQKDLNADYVRREGDGLPERLRAAAVALAIVVAESGTVHGALSELLLELDRAD